MLDPVGSGITSSRRKAILLRIALYGVVLPLGLCFSFSQVLLRAGGTPPERPPAGVEEVRVSSAGLRLRGWLLRGSDRRRAAAVVVHGLGDSLESQLDVGRMLQRRGHSVLLIDLRGHGGSEGKVTTLGGLEREDVRGGFAYLTEAGLASSGCIAMGVSMGAVACLRAAADREDIRAVIAEAPFDTYRSTIAHHAWLFYKVPEWVPLISWSIALAEWRGGFRADDVDAVRAAAHVRAPLLAIVDGADRRMPERVVRRVFDAHPGPKRLWVASEMDHAQASHHPDYWKTVMGFLEDSGA